MIIALVGPSGAGKSLVEKMLCEQCDYDKMISYTTRKPRTGEEYGKDYYFINNELFDAMINDGAFAEYEEYSQKRFYGTVKEGYESSTDKVVVLTPNGFRQLKRNCNLDNIVTVMITANLGTRVKRYIDRCGVKEFNFDDANEIFARINRDFGMFFGVQDEVDLVVDNSQGKPIADVVGEILTYIATSKSENSL